MCRADMSGRWQDETVSLTISNTEGLPVGRTVVRKQAKKTGDFGIGMMIHAVHMTDDVTKLNQFYEDVFGGLVYMGVDEPNFLPPEDRWAGLIMISDLCIETMAPNTPV